MNDPLSDRLRDAVPEPPDLTGLAGRAEATARRRRRHRRTAVVAAAAIAVVAAVATPFLVADRGGVSAGPDPATASPRTPAPDPTPPGPADCADRPSVHGDFATGTATWVRFCPLGGDAALVSDQVLTDGIAGLVDGWRSRLSTGYAHSCPAVLGAVGFRIRVGFADGTVSVIRGDTGACAGAVGQHQGLEGVASVFDELTRGLAAAAAEGVPAGEPTTPLRCPARAGDVPVTSNSSSPPADAGPLLDLPATGGVVCRYSAEAAPVSHRSLDAETAESVRVALAGSFDAPGGGYVRYGGTRPQPAFVVLLRDASGNSRAFRISGRQHRVALFRGSPAAPGPLGKAGEQLLYAVTGSYG